MSSLWWLEFPARETSPLSSSSFRHFTNFLTCSSLWFRKLRRVCSACLNADKRLKAQLVGSPPEVEEDTKSDVSEIQSQRTGSVLSGREESDTGGLDAADAHSESQPGTLCWAHCVVCFGKTLNSHSASPPWCINGHRRI